MNLKISKSLSFLLWANFIVILGSSITWTGLSYDLATKYDDPRFMGLMQVLSVLTSLIGPFIGLWLNAKLKLGSIIVTSESIATICCTFIFILINYFTHLDSPQIIAISMLVFMILLSGSISGLFIEPLYANLIEKRDGSDKNVRSAFAKFACFGILSKLFGMSIGPSLFAMIGQYSLLLNALSFFISALLLRITMNIIPSDIGIVSIQAEEVTIFKKSSWIHVTGLPLFETAIANSLILVVVLAMSTQAMSLQASPFELSMFWFGATGCAFLSHFLLSRFSKIAESLFRLEKKLGFLQITPILIGLLTAEVKVLVISQWIFSLLNPLATNQSRADFYRVYGRGKEKVLDAYAIRSLLTNAIVLLFSLFISIMGTQSVTIFLTLSLAGLILLRWEIARRVLVRSRQETLESYD